MTPEISFNDPDIQRCPFAAYKEIREAGPVYYDKSNGFHIVTGYDDIRKAAMDTKTFSSVTGQLLVKTAPYQERIDAIYREEGYLPVTALVVADPPIHSFHRSLVDKVFTVSSVKRMEEYLAGVVDEMVDQVIGSGAADFYYDLAVKIPNHVLSDQIGLPRERFADFKRWADAEAINLWATFIEHLRDALEQAAGRSAVALAREDDAVLGAPAGEELRQVDDLLRLRRWGRYVVAVLGLEGLLVVRVVEEVLAVGDRLRAGVERVEVDLPVGLHGALGPVHLRGEQRVGT